MGVHALRRGSFPMRCMQPLSYKGCLAVCKRTVGQKCTACSVELRDGYPAPTRSPRV